MKMPPKRAQKRLGVVASIRKRRRPASDELSWSLSGDISEEEEEDKLKEHKRGLTKPTLSWVAATETRNYMLKDGFLDYLRYHYQQFLIMFPHLASSHRKALDNFSNKNSFSETIMKQGCLFERKIQEELVLRFGEKVINIRGNESPQSDAKYQETLEALQDQVPIILSGIVRDEHKRIFGVPDLIVRHDYLDQIFDNINTVIPPYGYYIVEIKYTTLSLLSNGIHLSNAKAFPAYKAQLSVYTQCLSSMLDLNIQMAFMMGKKWQYTKARQSHKGENCFERAALIDFSEADAEYIVRTGRAVDWIRAVKDEGDNWDLTKVPLPRPELYPNMCNGLDHPYHDVKLKYAQEIGEISLLWYCGPKERQKAHEHQKYRWFECTSDILGVNGEVRGHILDQILKINQADNAEILSPSVLSNQKWANQSAVEFYVDFEMTCGVLSDLDRDLHTASDSYIFMIGCVWREPDTKRRHLKTFTATECTEEGERQICSDFYKYIDNISYQYGADLNTSPVYHWSSAERTAWNRVLQRNPKKEMKWSGVNWLDLCQWFRDDAIVIKGCFNYSLKTIARSFHEHGFISVIWDKDSGCVDGADAAVQAHNIWLEAQDRGLAFCDMPQVKEIEKYNYIDCRVMMDILEYLRVTCVPPLDEMEISVEDDEEDSSSSPQSVSPNTMKLAHWLKNKPEMLTPKPMFIPKIPDN